VNLGHGDDLAREYDEPLMEGRCHAVLDAAWDGGIRYVDVARSYGRAEAFLASWLERRRRRPEELMVGSKWGYTYTAGWSVTAEHHEVKDHSLATLTRQLVESKALLGDHLDLYQVHSATLDSRVLRDDAVLDALARVRDQGLPVGLTTSGPDQPVVVRQALEIERGGDALFASVQSTWNLLEQSARAALTDAHEAGLLVIVKETLANGRLTVRNVELPPYPGADVSTVALATAMAQPWADVVLSGAATVEQLTANLAAAVPGAGWADVDLSEWAETPEAYWSKRRALPWN
jgi:aryl-alcohol dehydrogenase-like predicted oxidoreductase